MNPDTLQIEEVSDEADALARKLIPIPPQEIETVRSMNREQRADWVKRHMNMSHSAARLPGETDDDAHKARNARKAQRWERRK